MMEALVMEGRSLGDQPGQQDQWGKVQALPMPALLCLLLSPGLCQHGALEAEPAPSLGYTVYPGPFYHCGL